MNEQPDRLPADDECHCVLCVGGREMGGEIESHAAVPVVSFSGLVTRPVPTAAQIRLEDRR